MNKKELLQYVAYAAGVAMIICSFAYFIIDVITFKLCLSNIAAYAAYVAVGVALLIFNRLRCNAKRLKRSGKRSKLV